MQATRFHCKTVSSFIASKLCSHRLAPTVDCISLLNQCPADAGPAFAANGGFASHTNTIKPMNAQPSSVK